MNRVASPLPSAKPVRIPASARPRGRQFPAARSKRVATLGEHIKSLRVASGATGGEFAKRCGISRSMVSRIERGQTTPSIDTLYKVADALGLPAAAMLDVDTRYWRQLLIEAMVLRIDPEARQL